MKRSPFLTIICLILCLIFVMQGCSFKQGEDEPKTPLPTMKAAASPTEAPTAEPTPEPTAEPTQEPTAEPTPMPTAEPTPEPTPDAFGDVGEYAREKLLTAQTIMDDLIKYIYAHPIACDSKTHPFVPAGRYSSLDETEKLIYDDMLEAARGFLRYSVLAESDEQVQAASAALFWDHPEIEIYFTMEEGENEAADVRRVIGEVGWHSKIVTPESRYFKEAEDIETVKAQVEAFNAVGAYVGSRVPEDFSPIDKYRLLAYYISVVTQYAHVNGVKPLYTTCAYGAVIKGYSICQGYALGFEYLCRMANLDCRRVRNRYNDANMHFWDEVTLDGGTYYVDVTWCDDSSRPYAQSGWFEWFFFPGDEWHVPNDGTKTTGKPLDRRSWE